MIIILNAVFFSALAIYFLASLIEFIGALFKKTRLKNTAWIFFILAFILNTAYIIGRGIIARHMPLANQFEFATGFAWALALMYIITRIKFKADWISIVAMPATFLLLSYAALLPREINDLMPALRSAWFTIHIGAAVFSYAAFTVSGCIGVTYLVRLKKSGSMKETDEWILSDDKLIQMDYMSYRLIALGFLLLTVVILSGCIWAEQAWSSFWSWDPKETWALITWIVYAIYLHQRLRRNWSGKRMAIFAIVAVIIVLFTFIGVNTLLHGLHSYK